MQKIIKLSKYAEMMGVSYVTAFRWFKNKKIEGAFQLDSSSIFIKLPEEDKPNVPQSISVYCRVSNQSRKNEMEYQVDRCVKFCNERGLKVDTIFKEIASGMNDKRKKFWEMLDKKPTIIVVENKDRLTRFGFNYLEKLLKNQGCEIIVMNPNKDDEQDLIRDLVSVITSFCCRLYGLRRMKNKVDRIKTILYEKKDDQIQ